MIAAGCVCDVASNRNFKGLSQLFTTCNLATSGAVVAWSVPAGVYGGVGINDWLRFWEAPLRAIDIIAIFESQKGLYTYKNRRSFQQGLTDLNLQDLDQQ